MAAAELFDSAFLARLEQLHLLARRLFYGERRAERRSRQTGSSIEFADHREYTPGDELRSIDWPAYARLDRLLVKQFEHEQDLPVILLLDVSASMRWKAPGTALDVLSKHDAARRLAAALAYIALANLDSIQVHAFASAIVTELGVLRGKAHFHNVLRFLREVPDASGPTSMVDVVRAFTQRMKRRGLVIVIGDFLDPAGFEEPLALLQHSQFEVQVLQIVDPAEQEPSWLGDLRLNEAETGATLDVTVNEALLRTYREEVRAFNESLENYCRQRAIPHAQITTAQPFDEVVLKVLRDGILLR